MNYSNVSAFEIDVSLAQQGDQKAFTRLIESTKNTVSSIALAIVKDIDASEDVAQQVYIAAWKGLTSLKNNASFLPWLRQTTRYKAFNYLRDNKVADRINSDEAELLIESFCLSDDLPDEAMHRQNQTVILKQVLDELPEESREIVLLYYREEQSTRQVAELLEIQESLVRKRLSRVREVLKSQLLEKYGRMILSTAPTIGFVGVVASALTGTSPVAAATIATSMASGKTTLASKVIAFLGGAFIGIAGGILGAWWGAKNQIDSVNDAEIKEQLIRNRNGLIVWIVLFGALFSSSYQFTTGWVGPMISYLLFFIGLIGLIWRNNLYYDKKKYGKRELTIKEQKRRRFEWFCGRWGSLLGGIMGFGGLIVGLLSSGRLSL
ncbi:RNA polymerase sigma factor [Pleionea sediminis]|uniref:RNA polymerase sigma factor n=1 Tax=Pleionea sediminis TaxID=2569479 RepID=UPI0011870CE1|nr:sigma-70 family RNA polymerase sigma factor [Pleionea sediminis]